MEDIRYAEGKYIQVPINEKSVITEMSNDFTLPDYHPEIKRLLHVSASVLPPTKYVGDSESEFSGGIDYYVLYTGSDNQIYCAPLSSEYKVSVPMDKNELSLANINADADIVAESVNGRVTSPRKLNIKCRLKSDARMYGDMPIDKSYVSQSGDNKVLFGKSDTSRRIFAQSEMIRLSDEIIQSANDAETRVINADGHAMIGETTALNGAVSCKGEIYLKLLMCKEEDGEPYSVLRRIPFSENISVDGAVHGCEVNARGTVCEMNISVEENRIGIDVGIMIELSVCKNETVSYVKDAYSTIHDTECIYRTVPYLSCGRAFNANFTQSDSVTLEEIGLTAEHKITDICGCAYVENTALDGERWVFSGKTKFSILAEKDGEYVHTDIEMPYRYTVDSKKCDGDNLYAHATAEVINSRARFDGERVGIDAELLMRCMLSSRKNAQMLDGMSFGGEVKKRGAEYIICYPSNDDTLWDVAKRYKTTVSELVSKNKLADQADPDTRDSIASSHYLVI